jgi:hypothetical protein
MMDDAKKDFGQLRQGEKATVSAKLSRCLGGVWVHVSFWDMVDGELASQPPPEFGRVQSEEAAPSSLQRAAVPVPPP